MRLLSSQTIYDYFIEYINDTAKPIKSYPGFIKYLIDVKKFDKTSLSDTKKVFIDDSELLKFIKNYCEGSIVEMSLLGLAHASMSQFILKNKHGYDSAVTEGSDNKSTIVNIVLDTKVAQSDS